MSRELARKLFHMLTLVYLWAYWSWGRARVLWVLAGWIALEGVVELVRLRVPSVNERLIGLFGSIHRESEAHGVSGILWTGLGCWLAILLFGRREEVVFASILYLALGDAAAALVGKSIGRTPLPFGDGKKTLEGSLACLAVCLAVGWFSGLGPGRMVAGAVAATFIECVTLPLNDNLWLPVGSGLVLYLCV